MQTHPLSHTSTFTLTRTQARAIAPSPKRTYSLACQVRAVVRKRKQMAEVQARWGPDVQVVNGDIRQPALLKAVFADDINAAFWATPTDPGSFWWPGNCPCWSLHALFTCLHACINLC